MRHAALLRGINVGGKNRLAMADLVTLFAQAGCTAITTHIQSGNVVFSASAKLAATIAAQIERLIARDLHLTVPVVVRSGPDLAGALAANPFPTRATATLHVMFLAARPTAAALASLDPRRSPGDELAALGREIYLSCPNGLGTSKFTNSYFDRTLATISTCRNWRTVQKLAELTST